MLLLLLACATHDDKSTDTQVDASTTPTTGTTTTDTATTEPPADCDVSGLGAYAPVTVQTLQLPPSVTARDGEQIDDTLQGTYKEHYIQRRDDGGADRQELFLWLGGSGSEPQNYDWILNMAAFSGYLAVSLAYDNETSVGDTCDNDAVEACSSANVDCEEEVRYEMIYGEDTSPCLEVTRANSIENRVLRLLQYAVTAQPDAGFERYLDETGEAIDWSHIMVAGWSQGGGHAGMIARDHLVARGLFVSKGAGAVACTQLDPDGDCTGDPEDTADDLDAMVVPAPWADDPRVTPGSREFGSIHQDEDAWLYSRETFAAFDMPGAATPVDIDPLGPYPDAYADYGCSHVFSTAATPNLDNCDANDFHKSMASDSCLAIGDDGVPVLAAAYVYAMTVPVE